MSSIPAFRFMGDGDVSDDGMAASTSSSASVASTSNPVSQRLSFSGLLGSTAQKENHPSLAESKDVYGVLAEARDGWISRRGSAKSVVPVISSAGQRFENIFHLLNLLEGTSAQLINQAFRRVSNTSQ